MDKIHYILKASVLSETQYRESNETEYPPIEQQDKEKGEQLVAG